jgi:hypothetical protein
MGDDARAVLLTGVYGAGKTTVAEEVAAWLEAGGPPFAAIDLDWLNWSNVAGGGHDGPAVLAANLRAVVGTFRAAGARRFVLAGSVADGVTLRAVRDAVAMPLIVIRLEVPVAVIEARLVGAAARGRTEDLEVARAWIAEGTGVGLEDEVLDGTPSPGETARRVIELAGWTLP